MLGTIPVLALALFAVAIVANFGGFDADPAESALFARTTNGPKAIPPGTTTTSIYYAQSVDTRPSNWPSKSSEQSATPLGRPAPFEAVAGAQHRFLARQRGGGSPVSYDPCRPIHYVTRPGGPENGDQLIREAIDRLSRATGFVFVDDGITDEAPSNARLAVQPGVYGDRWAPLLIAWSDAQESPMLENWGSSRDGDVVGYAGSYAAGIPGGKIAYVTGMVVLDGPDMATILTRLENGRDVARGVILHELAHVVGLDHVPDRSQLLFPSIQLDRFDYGPGDLEGLAALNPGVCIPEI